MSEITTRGRPLAGNWQRSRVEIRVAGENMRIVAAYVHDNAKGLAVTSSTSKDPGDRGRYSITHIATGREIAELLSLRVAKRVALELAPLAKWTDAMPDVQQWRSPADLFGAVERTVRAHTVGAARRNLEPRAVSAEVTETRGKAWLAKAIDRYVAEGNAGAADRIERALEVLNEGTP